MKIQGVLVGLALWTILAGLATRVQAQAPTAPPGKIYTKRMAFKLPVRIDDKDRAALGQIQLYVKSGPNEPWVCKETASPAQPEFTYRVAHDGEYWFSVVTVDKNGKMTPADVSREAPGLMVVVDTKPPEIDVRPAPGPNGQPLLQCVIRDANPDYSKVKLEYRTAHTMWRPLEPFPEQPGMFRVFDPSLQGLVRATATDRAGNTTTREVNLMALASVAPDKAMPGAMESQVEKPALPPPPAALAAGPPPIPGLQVINSTHASLEYQIDDVGPSGVGKVEVWYTRDEGQSWQRLCADADRRSPVEIDLPGEGLYGLSLVVTNGNGSGAAPPARGDVPNWWVEVDTTRPVAELLSVRPGSGEDANMMTIAWTASDKNLKTEPIDLYYATHREGPWLPIVLGAKNLGSFQWPVPRGVGPEIFVRMEVTDRAGNSTRCETTQAVVLDPSRPRARVVGLTTGIPRPVSPIAN